MTQINFHFPVETVSKQGTLTIVRLSVETKMFSLYVVEASALYSGAY